MRPIHVPTYQANVNKSDSSRSGSRAGKRENRKRWNTSRIARCKEKKSRFLRASRLVQFIRPRDEKLTLRYSADLNTANTSRYSLFKNVDRCYRVPWRYSDVRSRQSTSIHKNLGENCGDKQVNNKTGGVSLKVSLKNLNSDRTSFGEIYFRYIVEKKKEERKKKTRLTVFDARERIACRRKTSLKISHRFA